MVCDRCNGRGKLPWFSKVSDGICFQCNGTGLMLPKLSEFKKVGRCPRSGIRWNWYAKRRGVESLYSVGRDSSGTVYIYNSRSSSYYEIPNQYRLAARESFKII